MFTYLIRCEDGSLYCGYTTDIANRYKKHKDGKGAKYTRNKKVKSLELYIELYLKSDAMRLEALIKNRFSKKEKEELINGDDSLIDQFQLDYKRIVRRPDMDILYT